MEQTPVSTIPASKIYKENAIWGGTFLGGPLAGAYFMAKNFKAFNQPGRAKKTWFIAIAFTVVLLAGLFSIPDDVHISNHILPITYTAIMWSLAKHFQGDAIRNYLHAGGSSFSGWRVFGIGLIFAVITTIPVFAVAYIIDSVPADTVSSKAYGTKQNIIDYDNSNLTEAEVDRLADALTKTAFFDNEASKYVYLQKVKESYELTISVVAGTGTDREASQVFADFRNDLQTYFPDTKIVLNLVADDEVDKLVKRIE